MADDIVIRHFLFYLIDRNKKRVILLFSFLHSEKRGERTKTTQKLKTTKIQNFAGSSFARGRSFVE